MGPHSYYEKPQPKAKKLSQAPGNVRIVLDLQEIDFYCLDTCGGYIEVKMKNFQETGPRFCCEKPRTLLASEGPEMLLLYRTDTFVSSYKGFVARYRIEGTAPATTAPRVTQRPRVTYAPATQRPRQTYAPRPTYAPKPTWSPWGAWGEWGPWSWCTVTCGGCGKRDRRRVCGGTCGGASFQQQACGLSPCPVQPVQQKWCKGTFKVPCDRVDMIFGDPSQAADTLNQLPDHLIRHDPAETHFGVDPEAPPAGVMVDQPIMIDAPPLPPPQHEPPPPPARPQNPRFKRDSPRRKKKGTTIAPQDGTNKAVTSGDFWYNREFAAAQLCTKTFWYLCRADRSGKMIEISLQADVPPDPPLADWSQGACCKDYEVRGNQCYMKYSDFNGMFDFEHK